MFRNTPLICAICMVLFHGSFKNVVWLILSFKLMTSLRIKEKHFPVVDFKYFYVMFISKLCDYASVLFNCDS